MDKPRHRMRMTVDYDLAGHPASIDGSKLAPYDEQELLEHCKEAKKVVSFNFQYWLLDHWTPPGRIPEVQIEIEEVN